LELEEVKVNMYVRIFMIIMWLGTGATLIVFLVGTTQQLINSFNNPRNAISIQQEAILPLPAVTVCNWNQLVPPMMVCPECELTLIACMNFGDNNNPDCTHLWTPRNWNTQNGLFFCYEFNNDLNNIRLSNSTGYSGSMATVWGVKPLPSTTPPQNRAAVQATFEIQNKTDANAIYGEISFAAAGLDTFFGLTLINTVHNDLSTTAPNYNVTNYNKETSSVKLLSPKNASMAYVGVSFSFQMLSVQYITFTMGYTLNNYFGDFAGMIGVLMGMDVIKLSMGIPTAFIAFKEKSLVPLEELFNG